MLHVTNGDAAADLVRSARLGGDVVVWRDVLHEGPVPAGQSPTELRQTRAAFLAGCGWGDRATIFRDMEQRDGRLREAAGQGEIVLWFEHDLYDQLQVLQVLDRLGGMPAGVERGRVTLVNPPEFLGLSTIDRLSDLFRRRPEVSEATFAAARRAWEAFRSPDPRALAAQAASGIGALPFAGPALSRLIEEYPAVRDGLARSERQILGALVDGPLDFAALFSAAERMENPPFLGDAVFGRQLGQLGRGPARLVALDGGAEIPEPLGLLPAIALGAARFQLTPAGRAVVSGYADRVELLGLRRWIGGVELRSPDQVWRFDAARDHLIEPRPRGTRHEGARPLVRS